MMKTGFKAAAIAVFAVFTGSGAYAAMPAGLESAAAAISEAAVAGDNARAEALLSGLFAGGLSAEAAEPVRFEARAAAAYQAAPAAAPAVRRKAAPMPELPAFAEVSKSADFEIAPTAVEGAGESAGESAGKTGAKEGRADEAKAGSDKPAPKPGALLAEGVLAVGLGLLLAAGLIMLLSPAALLLVL